MPDVHQIISSVIIYHRRHKSITCANIKPSRNLQIGLVETNQGRNGNTTNSTRYGNSVVSLQVEGDSRKAWARKRKRKERRKKTDRNKRG